MPPVVAQVTASLFLSGLSIGIATLAANVIVSLATNLVLGALSKALTPKPKSPEAAAAQLRDRTVAVRQPITHHRIIYGQVRVSGPYTFIHSTESNKYLHLVITLAAHEVEEIGDIYFNDELVPLDGSGNATGKYAGYVTIVKGLGTATDTALINALVANTAGTWTTAHKQSGRAKIYVKLQYSQDLFASGIPNVSSIVKGKKLYDPRTTTTVYSANSALCVRDYLTSTGYGLGEPVARIDDAAIIVAANICDEQVNILPSGTENRYTCNGVVETDSQPKDVIGKLLSSLSGIATYSGGKWRLVAGAYRTPTITLDEDDLDGPIKVNTRISRRELFNGVKGVFVNPADFWQPTDFPPVTNATYLSQDQGERIWKDINLAYTTSASMAQRLAKIDLERARQQITTIWPCNMTAMRVQVGDVVNLTNTRFGWTAKPFDVVDWQFAVRGGADDPKIGIDLTLRETASTVYDWNSGEETILDPAPDTDLPNPFTVAAPGAPSVAESLYSTTDSAGVKAKATITWNVSADQFVRGYLPEYKLAADSTWTQLSFTTSASAVVNDIMPAIYDFRVRAENSIGVRSAYSATTTKELLGLTAKPSNVANFTVITFAGAAYGSWNLSTDLDVRIGGRVQIRHTELTAGETWEKAVVLDEFNGDAVTGKIDLIAGTYYATFVDSTGNFSLTPASFKTNEALLTGFTTVATTTQHTAFTGAKSGVIAADGILKLDGNELFDSSEMFDSNEPYDGNNVLSGEYLFDATLDLGSVASRRFHVGIKSEGFDAGDLFDSNELLDSTEMFDGTVVNDTDVTVLASVSDDNVAYATFAPFMVADFRCRYAKLKAQITSETPGHNRRITELSVTVKIAA